MRTRLGILVVALSLLGAGFTADRAPAADADLHVRIVQIKGTGKRGGKGAKLQLDKELEPLRDHLQQEGLTHGRYQFLAKENKSGPGSKALKFDLQNQHAAE